jgi:hypothetical protein
MRRASAEEVVSSLTTPLQVSLGSILPSFTILSPRRGEGTLLFLA